MSAHCNTCGDDLAWDLTCGRCEMTADRDRWKRLALDMGEALRVHRCKRQRGYQLPVKAVGATVFQDGEPEPLPVEACPTCALLARLNGLGENNS